MLSQAFEHVGMFRRALALVWAIRFGPPPPQFQPTALSFLWRGIDGIVSVPVGGASRALAIHPRGMGHSSVTLTLDTYSHIIPGLQELATEKLEQALFN
jgi:hypothetical protein